VSPDARRPWRRWNTALHRDIGYLAVGLTLVYALSGLAVNHMAHWNPNYRRTVKMFDVGPLDPQLAEEELTAQTLTRLRVSEKPRSAFQPDPDSLEIYLKEGKYSVDLPTGKVLFEGTVPRPVLMAMNRLHLNAPKRAWTWIADAYAVSLAFLALSGLFILRGKNGITGRGAWLTTLGCAIPVGYWIWWAYLA